MRKLAQVTIFPTSLLLTVILGVFALDAGVPASLVPAAITVLFLALVVVGERLLPRIGRAPEAGEIRADLGFIGLTALVSDPLAHAAIAALAVALAAWLPEGLLQAVPLWAGVVGVLLVGGFGDYWAHRLSHQWGWWWKLHSVHHAPHRMVALNNLRLHPLDLGLKLLFAVTPVLVLGFGPNAIAVAGALKGLNVAFQHADIDLRHGWLNRIVSTNSVHRWHHSARQHEANANYGGVLSVFDVVLGTYKVPPEDREPERMGLFEEKRYPLHQVVLSTVAPWCWARCVGAGRS